jgi:hypothetical protein
MSLGEIRDRAPDAQKGIPGVGFIVHGHQEWNIRAHLVGGGNPSLGNPERVPTAKRYRAARHPAQCSDDQFAGPAAHREFLPHSCLIEIKLKPQIVAARRCRTAMVDLRAKKIDSLINQSRASPSAFSMDNILAKLGQIMPRRCCRSSLRKLEKTK